ncbi:MAG: hypothetical protein LC104_12670 [Bacteroidales bacterium]|nr:hypothetical protein [Bacteroidales bacterium]
MEDKTKALHVVSEVRRVLDEGGLTPYREALFFRQVYESTNWRTGKQFTVKEAAAELGINYGRFRNGLMLVMPLVPASLTDDDRKGLLEAPADPSRIRRLLFGERR